MRHQNSSAALHARALENQSQFVYVRTIFIFLRAGLEQKERRTNTQRRSTNTFTLILRSISDTTMVVFTGTALGKAFSSTEAEDPFDLCLQLLPSNEPCKDYRMWIEVSAPATGNKFWFDVCLNSMSTEIYKAALEMWDGAGELNTVIRGAKEKSPNYEKTKFVHPSGENSSANFRGIALQSH